MDLIAKLVKEKIIEKRQGAQLRVEAKEKVKTFEELILEKKLLSEISLFELKSRLLKIPLKKTLPEEIPPETLKVIPRESVEYYKMAPLLLDRKEKVLEVGMVFPENPQAQQALKFLTRQEKFSLKIFLITFSDFRKYLEHYQAPKEEMGKALEKLEEEVKKVRVGAEEKEFRRLVEEAPIIKMVAVILREAIEGKASDIHIEPIRDSVRIRYRLDGILHPSLFLPLKVLPAIVARVKILSRLKIDETRIPQDGRFSTKIGDKTVDFRVSTFPTSLGEKVAIRVLDPTEGLKSLSELGLNQRNFQLLQEAIKRPFGLILATGPTGCGKTTTLYSIFRILNKEGVNVVTLEDPIEYFIDGVNQSQVKPEIGYDFAQGLRQIVRQDPDIIMVGEIRDEETAALSIHAALTGHLVLSTLHTNNASGVIPRLIDMKITPFLLPSTLSLALSQRLLRILCPFCKEKVKLEGETKKYILDKLKNLPAKEKTKIKLKEYIYQPNGCKKCNFKGYAGRIGAFEVIKMTDSLAKITAKNPSEIEILKEARRQGMITMEEDGVLKVLQGITSLEEVMRIAEEK
ncbi:MAG: GspE/PulE family protein [Patescibacteria group bacterium]|nr:GspE/PulE family protein [Patescibacteria group bacterium]